MSEEITELKNLLKEARSKLTQARKDLKEKKVLIEELEAKRAELSSLEPEVMVLREQNLALEEAAAEMASNSFTLSEETKNELVKLTEFLFQCYRESQNVGVRTSISVWRKLLSQLTQ